MTAIIVLVAVAVFLALTFAAWRQYLWAAKEPPQLGGDKCPYSLSDVFGDSHLVNVPHQKDIRWLSDVFSRSAKKFPHLTALQIPHTGESLTFAELDAHAEKIAAALAPFVTGADQVAAVAMSQDNWQIVASHLGILKAGGTLMFLDTSLPEVLITHMLEDAKPVVILTRGEKDFRGLPTLDVLDLSENLPVRELPTWLDDPAERLATIFYTSGTTGMPKGVECPHAGYVNLALSYADYFDLIPGMDATSLTSSLGYDGSISEMYSAWVSGCAVVMLTKEQIRSGPDLVPVLREAEVTVLFCPPVLLTTLTTNPEIDLPYPLCRYVVPAGEAFPAALVEVWTRNRRQIINTYGPTEASTDTSRQSLRVGETITIGSPFANVTYVILEFDGLSPLPHGEIGELCIGGVHVARGYRNLPEQTAQKFISHPEFGRLYRTGDKCRIEIETQRVHFLGRNDVQLKVRGHRVEAQAVEDMLQTQFSEIEAAVLDYQNEELVAFVAAPSLLNKSITDVAAAPAAWNDRVLSSLAKQLPSPSVPSRIFLVEKFAMKAVSGKIDRKSLPNLSGRPMTQSAVSESIRGTDINPLDNKRTPAADITKPNADCDRVLAICREVFETALDADDPFAESGGHSIVIARLSQKLRSAGWAIPVRSLLSDCNTARKIAARGRPIENDAGSRSNTPPADIAIERDESAAEVLSVRYFTFLQVLFTAILWTPGVVILMAIFDEVDDVTEVVNVGLGEFLVFSMLLYLLALATPFALLLWVMILKSFMSDHLYDNKVTPGLYPKWSKMHLRIWCVGRMEDMVITALRQMYRSAPIMAFVLRHLGAKVGDNLQCAHDVSIAAPIDLITIGDDVAIQTGAYLQPTSWTADFLCVGPITLESGCKIGMRAAVASNVTVGQGTWITPFTPILANTGRDEVWEGSPARLAGRCTELNRTAEVCQYDRPIWFLETQNVMMQVFLSFWLSAVPIALVLWIARSLIIGGSTGLPVNLSAVEMLRAYYPWLIYGFVTAWLSTVITSVIGCVFIRLTAMSPGLYPTRGTGSALLMYRMKTMNTIQRQWTWTITGQYLRSLAGLRFSRIGSSECDVMFNLIPEAASADSQVFWSSGSFTNMVDYGAEHTKLRRLDMPRNFFTGNNCVVEYGQFPDNFLLGVSTPASEIQFRRQMRSRRGEPLTVAGNPPLKFASASFETEIEAQKHPGFSLFLIRVALNDVFSIGALPITEGLIFAAVYVSLSALALHPMFHALAALILTELGLVLLSATVKKLLVGKDWGTKHSTLFWSWRHFAYFFAEDCFFVWCRQPLRFFAGTTVSNSILRLLGCEIGKRTIVAQPMQCFDWNAVSFGNDCYIDGFLQLHTFENMQLKVKQTHIGDQCCVNVGATVMGGVVIENKTTLQPLSMVLKEMNLSTATYEGSPAEPTAARVNFSAPTVISTAEAAESGSRFVDKTDWLKAIAIILVTVDHFGYFFLENDQWWAAFGRMAAPAFFFLMGYAETRKVPLRWLWLGVFLTMLDLANNDWNWMPPNILLSFALIRIGRPYAQALLLRYKWFALAAILLGLIFSLPLAAQVTDYGAEGWLWALFGMLQRMYVDRRSATDAEGQIQVLTEPRPTSATNAGFLRAVACIVAGVIYVWQEQKEFAFAGAQIVVFIVGIILLSVSLCLFIRGESRIKPPQFIAAAVRFAGRHTLEIYAVSLAAFELIVMFGSDLKP